MYNLYTEVQYWTTPLSLYSTLYYSQWSHTHGDISCIFCLSSLCIIYTLRYSTGPLPCLYTVHCTTPSGHIPMVTYHCYSVTHRVKELDRSNITSSLRSRIPTSSLAEGDGVGPHSILRAPDHWLSNQDEAIITITLHCRAHSGVPRGDYRPVQWW